MLAKDVTRTEQQRPESPTVSLTWHSSKYKVHKLDPRYILLIQTVSAFRVGALLGPKMYVAAWACNRELVLFEPVQRTSPLSFERAPEHVYKVQSVTDRSGNNSEYREQRAP